MNVLKKILNNKKIFMLITKEIFGKNLHFRCYVKWFFLLQNIILSCVYKCFCVYFVCICGVPTRFLSIAFTFRYKTSSPYLLHLETEYDIWTSSEKQAFIETIRSKLYVFSLIFFVDTWQLTRQTNRRLEKHMSHLLLSLLQ